MGPFERSGGRCVRVLGVGHCVQPHPSHAHDTPQRFGRIYHTPPTPPNAHAHTSPPHTQQPPNPPRWPLTCPSWWRASSAWPAPTPWCSASSRRRESTSSPVGLASQLPVWLPRNRGAIWAGRACDAWCPIAWHLGCPGGRRRSGCVWGCVRVCRVRVHVPAVKSHCRPAFRAAQPPPPHAPCRSSFACRSSGTRRPRSTRAPGPASASASRRAQRRRRRARCVCVCVCVHAHVCV